MLKRKMNPHSNGALKIIKEFVSFQMNADMTEKGTALADVKAMIKKGQGMEGKNFLQE